MLGPRSTAAAIDDFESRFTIVGGAHFLIAANGEEAWPISAAERAEFRALYRRRMLWARWLRRLAFIGLFPIVWLVVQIAAALPGWMQPANGTLQGFVIFALPVLGLLQHPIVSDLTKAGIERQLKQRMTTRHEAAVTPVTTPLGRFARRLLIVAVSIEVGLMALHALGGREEMAQHMRVFTGLTDGREGWQALVTGNIGWWAQYAIFAGIVLLMIDRRRKRDAERARAAAEAAQTADAGRDTTLRRLQRLGKETGRISEG